MIIGARIYLPPNRSQAIQGLAAVRDELRHQRRVSVLENREELLVERTRSAAAVAASNAVTHELVEDVAPIGALEAAQRDQRRLE